MHYLTTNDMHEAAAEIELLAWYHANGTMVPSDKPRAASMQRRLDSLRDLAAKLRDEAARNEELERRLDSLSYRSKVAGRVAKVG